MKITFQNHDFSDNAIRDSRSNGNSVRTSLNDAAVAKHQGKTNFGKAKAGKMGATTMGNGDSAALFGVQTSFGNNERLGFPGEKSKTSLAELQQGFDNIDVGISQDYNTVLAHTLSEEDYAKAKEEGFSIGALSQEDTVTIQDRVKAELALSGEVVAGYNDNMNEAVLAEALGSDLLAKAISESFWAADLPLNEENIQDVASAYEMEQKLDYPSEEAVAFMVENELEPTVWNIYLANNSKGQGGELFSLVEGADKYFTPKAMELLSDERFSKQIDQVIQQSEFENLEEGRVAAAFLLDKDLPLTVESMNLLQDISKIKLPMAAEDFGAAAVAAISQGLSAKNADLNMEQGTYETVYQRAANLYKEFSSDEVLNKYGLELSSRRLLEEVRLSMTAEVNVKLLSSGFSIDTAPMEELIDALKEAESQVAQRYFPENQEAVESYRLMNQTNASVAEIKYQPADSLGMFVTRSAEDITLSQFHREGQILRDTYVKAGETYEALMTAPRSDLGDNIRKAFANVDDLIMGLEMDISEENRRAVRILGYNSMSITAENIDTVKLADRQVTDIVSRMTPSAVLGMIRDGMNPLEADFEQLRDYFSAKELTENDKEVQDYANYLYALERQNEITEEERSGYIGIYRLLHQIEKSDGAAIGAVLHEQAELSFSNLISAVRSGRFGALDVKISDEFGGTVDIISGGNRITDQIAEAFLSNRNQQEQQQMQEEYRQYQENARTLIQEDRHLEELLQNAAKEDNSLENLGAVTNLLSSNTNLYAELQKSLRSYEEKKQAGGAKDKEKALELQNLMAKKERIDSLMGDYLEALGAPETFEEKYAELNDSLDSTVQEMELEIADSYIDVKAMQLISRQISVAMNPVMQNADTEDYVLPLTIGDQIAKVHLSFQKGEESEVHLRVVQEDSLFLQAAFSLRNGDFSGYVSGNDGNALQNIQEITDKFIVSLKNKKAFEEIRVGELPVVLKGEGGALEKSNKLKTDSSRIQAEGKDAEKTKSDGAERGLLLRIAKEFLSSI